MGFLSSFDSGPLSLSKSDSKSFSWMDDNDLSRAYAFQGNPLLSQWLTGNAGLFGTPTEQGTHHPWAIDGITDEAHSHGAEIAAMIAAGAYGYGAYGGDFGASESTVGAGDAGMGEGWNLGEVNGTGTDGGTGGLDYYDKGLDYPDNGVTGDPTTGSEFPSYSQPGSANAMDAEPGWTSNGGDQSTLTSGNNGGGNAVTKSGMPNTWQGWAKAMGPGAVMGGLQMYGNYRKNASAEERNKRAREEYERQHAAQDAPPVNPYISRIGPMTAQQFADDPLSTYGQRREHQYFKASGGLAMAEDDGGRDELSMGEPMMLEGPQGPPQGGLDRAGRVHGEGGGQEDNVPAMLSPDEYVWDADTVAAIGDGSSDEGARRLDAFREELRAHKRAAPISKIPPKTKPLDYYMKKAA